MKRYIIKPNAVFTIKGSVPNLRVSEEEFDDLRDLAVAENWEEFDRKIASYYDGTWVEKAGVTEDDAEVEGSIPPEFIVEESER